MTARRFFRNLYGHRPEEGVFRKRKRNRTVKAKRKTDRIGTGRNLKPETVLEKSEAREKRTGCTFRPAKAGKHVRMRTANAESAMSSEGRWRCGRPQGWPRRTEDDTKARNCPRAVPRFCLRGGWAAKAAGLDVLARDDICALHAPAWPDVREKYFAGRGCGIIPEKHPFHRFQKRPGKIVPMLMCGETLRLAGECQNWTCCRNFRAEKKPSFDSIIPAARG